MSTRITTSLKFYCLTQFILWISCTLSTL